MLKLIIAKRYFIMKFTKMQGAGNDYVYINGLEFVPECPEELAKKISNRHFGVGSDGLVVILPSEGCDFRMRIFNADGSEAEMCGNASRCIGKYVYDKGLTDKTHISLETKAGIKYLTLYVKDNHVERVRVDMGVPVFSPENIPVRYSAKTVLSEPVNIEGMLVKMSCISMGNPHAVIFLDDLERYDLHKLGNVLEHHPLFPERTNVEFVKVIARDCLRMRVWERGSGETLACGTGACASLVAAVMNGYTDRKAVLKLSGGDLEVEWNDDNNHVYMTGDAVTVFEGEYYLE